MSVKDLIGRLTGQARALPQVVAPVLENKGAVRVTINRLPYYLRVEVPSPNWYVLQPVSSTWAEAVRTAEPFEIQNCLKNQPRLKVISVRRWKESSWLVFPFNLSDARSRDFPAEPQPCYLIDREMQPFTAIRLRAWGDHLVFDPAQRPEVAQDFLDAIERQDAHVPEVKGAGPEYSIVYRILLEELEQRKKALEEAQKKTVEGRIKDSVEYLGAEYVGYSETGDGYTVQWKDRDQIYRTRVRRDLRLISAGICLSGRDREQTLTSLVPVMRRSRGTFAYYHDEEDDW